ncbi:MAG: type I restriction endonuclease, partial [Anaerolineaceae bacterium]
MTAPESIRLLVERFDEHKSEYHSSVYNETQLRREFLDPFFEALGWDVNNTTGYAEQYKQVIHEDAISVGGTTKAPDYAFRLGGIRKFFVEAKKPSVNIKDEISPAYQLRRYAWSAKLPLSILTDFEEFAVYDCRSKPNLADKAATGRIMLLKYSDYLDRWDELAGIFSPHAIQKGGFDRYAEETKGKSGAAEVDDAFLEEISNWRILLARNIALRNPALTSRELNYAVQMTIDRIIFLRICEDRGIEPTAQLQALLSGGSAYARMTEIFRKADARYNSGLFHFHVEKDLPGNPDSLTLSLQVDDKPLKEIIKSVYYPHSPYEFSVLPADILGQVYEQFLGKVIRLTEGHHAVVDDKPEVKKAGGVYYTPTYIVEYIVRQTVGSLLEGKQPGTKGLGGKGEPLRVLDPACGSGSFLLGAFQYLLDWYRDGYAANHPKKWAGGSHPLIYLTASGEWKLTTRERKRILLDHIYGVDIDPQAVEVTKLSLLLKVLEGESDQSLSYQMRLWQERALPDLSRNIKCGNSLIGSDYYTGRQLTFLDEEEQYRVNAFDWQSEFKEVFADAGGFDAVIGNPPYVRQELLGSQKTYFQSHYQVYHGVADLYSYFIERGVSLL